MRSLLQGRCEFGVDSPESSILYFPDLSTEVLGSYFSGAKAFYFGNSRISQRQKSIYFPSLPTAFASLLIPYPAQTVDKPYCLSHPSFVIKNASQEEEGKSRSDVA